MKVVLKVELCYLRSEPSNYSESLRICEIENLTSWREASYQRIPNVPWNQISPLKKVSDFANNKSVDDSVLSQKFGMDLL